MTEVRRGASAAEKTLVGIAIYLLAAATALLLFPASKTSAAFTDTAEMDVVITTGTW